MNDSRLDSALDTLRAATPTAQYSPSEQLIHTARRRTTRRRVGLGVAATVAAVAVVTTTVVTLNGNPQPNVVVANQPSSPSASSATTATPSATSASATPSTSTTPTSPTVKPTPTLPALTPADFSQQKWTKTAKDYGVSIDEAVAGPGRVVFLGIVPGGTADQATPSYRLVGLDAATGQQKWSQEHYSGSHLASSVSSFTATGPAVVVSTDLIPNADGTKTAKVIAVNAADGTQRWSYTLGTSTNGNGDYYYANSDLAVSGTTTVVWMGPQLWVFDSLSGDLRYTKSLKTATSQPDAQAGSWTQGAASLTSVAAMARPDGAKAAITVWDARTGEVQTSKTYTNGGLDVYSLALSDTHVFVSLLGKNAPSLIALPLTKNAQEWSQPLDSTLFTQVVFDVATNTVQVGYSTTSSSTSSSVSSGSVLKGYRAQDGRPLWTRDNLILGEVPKPGVALRFVDAADMSRGQQVVNPASDTALTQLAVPKESTDPNGLGSNDWEKTQLINYGSVLVVVSAQGLQELLR